MQEIELMPQKANKARAEYFRLITSDEPIRYSGDHDNLVEFLMALGLGLIMLLLLWLTSCFEVMPV